MDREHLPPYLGISRRMRGKKRRKGREGGRR
jgi:hypothetical protein